MVRVVTRTLGTLPLNRKQNVQWLRCHSILIMFTVVPLLEIGDRMGVFQTMAYTPGSTTFQKMESNQTSQTETTSFAKLKSLKKHEFHFFARLNTSKNMNFIFCKLKNLRKHAFHFLQAKKPQKR